MGRKGFEVSRADGMHAQLARMAGQWQGRFRLWFEPGPPAEDSVQRGSIRGRSEVAEQPLRSDRRHPEVDVDSAALTQIKAQTNSPAHHHVGCIANSSSS